MLTLSRGIEPFWINDKDAAQIGIFDNDWVEAYNDNGVIVTRAVVSARIPRGIGFFITRRNAQLRFPVRARKNRRGGGTNGVTRLRLKPVLMVGGYGQHCYRFNDYGAAGNRSRYLRDSSEAEEQARILLRGRITHECSLSGIDGFPSRQVHRLPYMQPRLQKSLDVKARNGVHVVE